MINRLTLLKQGFAAGLLLVLLCLPFTLTADEFRPALLNITEREGGWVDVTWKVPTMGDQVLALTPVMPEFLQQMGPGSGHKVSGAWVETKSYSAGGQVVAPVCGVGVKVYFRQINLKKTELQKKLF